jgi:uncharacterized protein (TIGR00369 family)
MPAQATDWKTILGERARTGLPGLLGIEVAEVGSAYLVLRLAILPHHVAPNGYLHAGTVVALADTSCGFGCISNLPPGAQNFTTVELKTNFLRSVTQGVLRSEARLVHGGRSTQVWDATVACDDGRTLALFRCTQMILY